MAPNTRLARYRRWYGILLRLYSRPYRERFAESMEQTFSDLCRERTEAGDGLFGFVLWVFVETSAGIMRENGRFIIMQKSIIRVALVTAGILLIPFFGNIYIDGWNWPPKAFAFWGALLFGTGLTYELIARKGNTIAYRAATGIAVAAGLVLFWMDVVMLADDVVGPANFLYFGVLAVGFVGAFIARFQPKGMARTLFVMAIAHALVPVIALIFWSHDLHPGVAAHAATGRFGPMIVQRVFVALWIVSALLYQRAVDPWSKIPREDRGLGASHAAVAD